MMENTTNIFESIEDEVLKLYTLVVYGDGKGFSKEYLEEKIEKILNGYPIVLHPSLLSYYASIKAERCEKKRDWYFSFGCGHTPYERNYVKIYGTQNGARRKMVKYFGARFCGQYPSKEALGAEKYGLTELKLETLDKEQCVKSKEYDY